MRSLTPEDEDMVNNSFSASTLHLPTHLLAPTCKNPEALFWSDQQLLLHSNLNSGTASVCSTLWLVLQEVGLYCMAQGLFEQQFFVSGIWPGQEKHAQKFAGYGSGYQAEGRSQSNCPKGFESIPFPPRHLSSWKFVTINLQEPLKLFPLFSATLESTTLISSVKALIHNPSLLKLPEQPRLVLELWAVTVQLTGASWAFAWLTGASGSWTFADDGFVMYCSVLNFSFLSATSQLCSSTMMA